MSTATQVTSEQPAAALHGALAPARTAAEAARALVAHLAGLGMPLPSLYLESGGRLRCLASHGYWQILDGIPASIGIVGSTFRSGRAHAVQSTPDSAEFLEAIVGVRSEVCVPIFLAGQVIGVLNVEGFGALPDGTTEVLEARAAAYAHRLAALGGRPAESEAQRLARHAVTLAGLDEQPAIEQYAAHAARDLSQFNSVLLARFDGADLTIRLADGRLAGTLAALDGEGLANIATLVRSGLSCYTIGEPTGEGFAGIDILRTAGAKAVIVLPLHAGDTFDGVLVLADETPEPLPTELIERLELLATETTSSLRRARLLEELREQARRDPLTGLGHHAAFTEELAAVARPRRLDDPPLAAALIIDLDGFKAVNDQRGHLAGDEHILRVAGWLAGSLRQGDTLFRIGGDEFAAILRVHSEDEAVGVAERLRGGVAEQGEGTVSIGVAVGPSDEAGRPLVARADQALYASKAAGRNRVTLAPPSPSTTR